MDAVRMDRELFKFKVVRLERGREFCGRHVGGRGTQEVVSVKVSLSWQRLY